MSLIRYPLLKRNENERKKRTSHLQRKAAVQALCACFMVHSKFRLTDNSGPEYDPEYLTRAQPAFLIDKSHNQT